MSAAAVARILADPASSVTLDEPMWTDIICAARAERLLGSLASRLGRLDLPLPVASSLAAARMEAEAGRVQALWEAEMARRTLARLDVPIVLLKGTAYVAAGLSAGQGRLIGDLDILVPRERLDEVQSALLGAGWEWVKPDPYDDAYYRNWMHELPPLIHRVRDRIIDVHHTIVPLTARPRPDAEALIADSQPLANGLRILCPEDMIVHAAAHLLADGDLSGGLRNLWDINCLAHEFQAEGFAAQLWARAERHGLEAEVRLAMELASEHFGWSPGKVETAGGGTPRGNRLSGGLETFPAGGSRRTMKGLITARLFARDGWGRPTRPLLRFAFYVRSHWLRMPPLMLARHLWIKWRKGSQA